MDLSASEKEQGALRSGQDKIKRYFESTHSTEFPFRFNQDDVPTLVRSSLDSSIDDKSTSEKNVQQNKLGSFPSALTQAQSYNQGNQKTSNQERILSEKASSNKNENNNNFLTLNKSNQKEFTSNVNDKNNVFNTSNMLIQGNADRNNNNILAEDSLFLTNRQSNFCLSPMNIQTINTKPNRGIEDSLMILKTQDPPSRQENEDNMNNNSPAHSQEIAINYIAQSKSPLNKNNTNRLDGSSRLNTPKISIGEPQILPLTNKPSQQSQLDFNMQNNNNSSNASNKRGSCTPQTAELIAKRNASSKLIRIGNHDMKKTKNFFFWSKVNFIKRKFVHALITRVPSARFRHLKKEQFRIINDASSEYGYFIHQNPLIFSEVNEKQI